MAPDGQAASGNCRWPLLYDTGRYGPFFASVPVRRVPASARRPKCRENRAKSAGLDERVRSPTAQARPFAGTVCPNDILKHKRPRAMSHQNLPTKTCPVCNREFEWRKKWEDDWENVKYCSERCRRNKDRDHIPWAKEE